LVINEIKETNGFLGYEIINSRKYFLNAETNEIQSADSINLPGVSHFSGCFEYDSKYSRFFIWQCGEGIGSSIPLKVYDLNTKTQKEIVTFQDFGLNKEYIGLIAVRYNNGYFLVIPKSKEYLSKIIVIDLNSKEIKKKFS